MRGGGRGCAAREVAASSEGLAEELRRALFLVREESLFTGTYRDSNKLYKPMIDVIDRAIAKYRREL